ncbi:hypothetical protein ApAK_01960 [Thermoplasmatales archaeon AK]|nr:hypothetical protein [Thermoplasmatales archaeon AK]
MESTFILTNENKAFYNARKRLGAGTARAVFDYWYHFHVDDPVNADEAIYYYILGKGAYERGSAVDYEDAAYISDDSLQLNEGGL